MWIGPVSSRRSTGSSARSHLAIPCSFSMPGTAWRSRVPTCCCPPTRPLLIPTRNSFCAVCRSPKPISSRPFAKRVRGCSFSRSMPAAIIRSKSLPGSRHVSRVALSGQPPGCARSAWKRVQPAACSRSTRPASVNRHSIAWGMQTSKRNSVFTRVFARKLRERGRHLADLMEDVKEEVAALAARVPHKQFPAYYNETQGGRIFLGGPSREGDTKPSDAELREQERQRRLDEDRQRKTQEEERQRRAEEEERQRRLQEEERRKLAALQPTAAGCSGRSTSCSPHGGGSTCRATSRNGLPMA